MKPLVPGRARLEFTEYLQPGPLAIELNTAANTLAAVTVATYLDQPEDVVALDVLFASLPDGTSSVADDPGREGQEHPRRHPEQRPSTRRAVTASRAGGLIHAINSCFFRS